MARIISEKKKQIKRMLIASTLTLFILAIVFFTQEVILTSQNVADENIQGENKIAESIILQADTKIIENLCQGIICNASTLVCPDKFIATCKNSCANTTGLCGFCTPNCTGHEQHTGGGGGSGGAIESNDELVIENLTADGNETTGNETNDNQTEDNETTDDNETVPSDMENDTEIENPQIEILFSYPDKITRDKTFEIEAIITNFGEERHLLARWVIPDNFEVDSEDLVKNCGYLDSGESCISTIRLEASHLTPLGINLIKMEVGYSSEDD